MPGFPLLKIVSLCQRFLFRLDVELKCSHEAQQSVQEELQTASEDIKVLVQQLREKKLR